MSALQSTLQSPPSQITLTRDLKHLIESGWVIRSGKGRATRYHLSDSATLLHPIDADTYFKTDPDRRVIRELFQFNLFETLNRIDLFSPKELATFSEWQTEYHSHRSRLSQAILRREFERLTIELSWKSSAIEGNTYSLLETETLLKEGIEAKGKKSEEAKMILNHKAALDWVRENAEDFRELTLPAIERVHTILTDGLGVTRNLRRTLVGITGTRFRPLDNEFQIAEAMRSACHLINQKNDCFTRALLAILLISYIQPFEDGNKRTSRIVANALLLASDSYPLSFRSVDETEYKKGILLFYEQNHIAHFKNLFVDQLKFGVTHYFKAS